MRIAVPIWEEKISPLLDTASTLLIIHRSEEQGTLSYTTPLVNKDISARTRIIVDLGIDVLICGALSRPFKAMLTSCGLEIISEISGPAQEVVKAFLDGKLNDSEYVMPGFTRSDCNSTRDDSDTFTEKNRKKEKVP